MKYFVLIILVICFQTASAGSWWGTPGPNSIYAGMWTFHFIPHSEQHDNPNNQLIMGVYKGYFLGTFIDSFYHRDYAAGIQRYWLQKPLPHDFEYYWGYRAGLVYGYSNHVIDLGKYTPPILPFAQLITSITWKHLGCELSYTGVVISTEFYIKF